MGKFYITTAIDYVNGDPHIGHAIQKVWADIIARHHRLSGDETFFLTGTDEHGINILRKASELGVTPQELADENSGKFRKMKEALNLSWDDFIRTSDKEKHWPGAILIWNKLAEKGDIYKSTYKGLYCAGHEAFITEKDMSGGKCVLHGKPPEEIDEENYFFRLSKYSQDIESRIKNNELRIIPETRKNEILSLLEEGLEDISFSRPAKDVPWGIPVPGDDSHTMYVWCDALTNYISAIGFGRNEDWKKWWPADVHILGKDNLRFHAAIWPGMLLSAGLDLPKTVLVNGFIQAGGRKMSKTLGNVVDPFDLVEHYGTDAVRYYFSREVPIFEDGDFTEDKFKAAYEGNLVNGLGNYIQRVSTMGVNYFDSKIEKPEDSEIMKVPMKKGEAEFVSVEYFAKEIIGNEYSEAMENFELTKAIDKAFMLLRELDIYVQTYEPFKLIKTDKEKTKAVLWNLSLGAFYLAKYLSSFLPETADKIFEIFGADKSSQDLAVFQIKKHEALFPRNAIL
ncbi:methionine--tRNA ligase [Candidatus Giovannonibacteria bacterium]|nr:methionine--tRNA ligase [Candidatus Giovannonibacteria bacterium]